MSESGYSLREPTPEEDEAIRVWSKALCDARNRMIKSVGMILAVCVLLMGIAVVGELISGKGSPADEICKVSVWVAILVIGGLIAHARYSRLGKKILKGAYKVTETEVTDKRLICHSRRYSTYYDKNVTVKVGGRQQSYNIFDPRKDEIFEKLVPGDKMVLICYDDYSRGFADGLDLVYIPAYLDSTREDKETD